MTYFLNLALHSVRYGNHGFISIAPKQAEIRFFIFKWIVKLFE
jgi:hypothetical protein